MPETDHTHELKEIWNKIDALTARTSSLEAEVKVAQANYVHLDRTIQALTTEVKALTAQVAHLSDIVTKAYGGIDFGRWLLPAALGVIGLVATLWARR